MRALLSLTVANIKSFIRDRQALFWTLAFPLIFIFLFGTIFSGGSSKEKIGWADADGTPASAQLHQVFRSVPVVELVEGTKDELLRLLVQGAKEMKLGDGLRPESAMGPLVAESQRKRVEDYVGIGVNEGARVITGGSAPEVIAARGADHAMVAAPPFRGKRALRRLPAGGSLWI